MIFPAEDRVLLAQELGTYGITYADAYDCLVIAPGLKGYPDRVGAVSGIESPLSVVSLLMYRDTYVGALFSSVAQLFSYFWNGDVPQEIPGEYISDLIGLYYADTRIKYGIDNKRAWRQALNIHERTRELVRDSGNLPNIVLDRIREQIEFVYTVH